ncbi:hypothetical protein MBLNU13_g00826t1 [Cladosporium sp. NU13]
MLLPTVRRSILTTRARAPLVVTSRPFSQAPIQLARKDTQDKDSLKPEPNEYSKSGSDDAAAAVEGAAFDPNQTRPEEEHARAAKESGSDTNPLEASPANHEISQSKVDKEGKTGGASGGQVTKDRESAAQSGGSGAPKSGGGKSG